MNDEKMSSIGDLRERQIYEMLVSRFGKNCVFRSPKIHQRGQEKELADVLVLALPYAIVIQSKWKKAGVEELLGEKGQVHKQRLITTMEEAAAQFKQLASSLMHNMIVRLPCPWSNDDRETFELPLKSVKHIIPIVIVDFEDNNYLNPELRYNDIPPIVVKVPSSVSSWGLVHAFLFKDFAQIVNKLFTVGDLLLWAKERSRLFGKTIRSVIGYNELSLFTFYLFRNDEWEKLLSFDMIWLADNDFFEHFEEKYANALRDRDSRFGGTCFFDVVEQVLIDTILAMDAEQRKKYISGYLKLWGRILCMPSMMKMPMANKLYENLGYSSSCIGIGMKCSYGLFDHRCPNAGVVFCLGATPYNDQTVESLSDYAYFRTLSYIKSAGKIESVNEVVVLLLRSDKPGVTYMIRKPQPQEYEACLSEEELKSSCKSFAKQDFKVSEWNTKIDTEEVASL